MWRYFKANKNTILSLYKVMGAYSTGIIAILFLATGFEFTSTLDVWFLFLTCVIVGHLITFSLLLMYLSVNYNLFSDHIKFYNELRNELKTEFKILLYEKPLSEKYGLLEVRIYCIWKGYLFNLMPSRAEKQVGVSVINDLNDVDFHKITKYIDNQYKRDSICMTGFGVRKTIKIAEWNLLEVDDLKRILKELVNVSESEKLDVVKIEQSEE